MVDLRKHSQIINTHTHSDFVARAQQPAATQQYAIDAKASRFTVKAFASGMSAGLGHNPTIAIRDFNGEGEFSQNLEQASLALNIRAESLKVEDEMRDDDRRTLERIMRDQVLVTSIFPEILFESSSITSLKLSEGVYQATIVGKLTLHGVTRRHYFVSQVTVGAYNLRASGEFEIRQSDFDIKPVAIAGGALTVQDELKFAFFMVAKLRE